MNNNIYVSSGGGKPPYGLISAEFQSGVCTCTDENSTQVQIANSSPAMFPVQMAGTYYLTASDGDKSASAQVEITQVSQLEKVELAYALVLWEPGNNNTELTGGWISVANGSSFSSSAVTDDEFRISCGHSSMASSVAMATKNKIDLSKYTSLNVTVSDNSSLAGSSTFGVSSSNSTVYNKLASADLAKGTVCRLDITNVDSAYVHVGMNNQSLSTKHCYFSKIWLE